MNQDYSIIVSDKDELKELYEIFLKIKALSFYWADESRNFFDVYSRELNTTPSMVFYYRFPYDSKVRRLMTGWDRLHEINSEELVNPILAYDFIRRYKGETMDLMMDKLDNLLKDERTKL